MKKTLFSLYYLAGYLVPTGLMLIFAPNLAFKLLFSTGNYGDVMPRFAGLILLALGLLVVQIIRHRVEVLYSTTIVLRAFVFVPGLLSLYFYTRDPFFLIVIGVVGFGLAFTGVSYLRDRGAKT